MNADPKFIDIYDYVYTPFYKTNIFIVISSLLLLALIITLAYIFIKKRHNKQNIQVITHWEWALRELKKMAPSKYETKEEFKKFYFDITELIKLYLQKRFNFNLMEKTDEELLKYLKDKSFDEENIYVIKNILDGSLLIKFANEQAIKENALKSLKETIELVKRTIPNV